MSIYRITRLKCGQCGRAQRCKILQAGSVEVMPECYACGSSSAWFSPIKLDPPASAIDLRYRDVIEIDLE